MTTNVPNFSLVIGGPFYRGLVHLHLVDHPGPNIRGRLGATFLLTWVPLLLLCLAAGTALGGAVRIPFLRDYSIYGRFIAALPLLLISEVAIDPWLRRAVAHFENTGLVRPEQQGQLHKELASVERLRDSGFAELVMALLAAIPVFLYTDSEWARGAVSSWHRLPSGELTPAGWWFAFVSSPILRFLLFRWVWRYALWCDLLRRIARLNLDLLPTHADRLAGLGFMLHTQSHCGILFAALGSFIAGHYANAILYFGLPPSATQGPIVVFLIGSVLLALGPLTLLSRRLFEARQSGIARYDPIARRLSAEFDSKWTGTSGPKPSMLGNQDPSSLTDYISCYQVIREMQVIPVSKKLVIQVIAQAAAPMAVAWIAISPVDKIAGALFKMIL